MEGSEEAVDLQGAILIDISAESNIDVELDFLEGLGHPVLVCHGPPHATLCPLVARTGEAACEMVAAAHGVIFELDLDRPQHRAILRRYQETLAEDVPIRAVVGPQQRARYQDILEGVSVWERQPSIGELDGFAAEVEAYDRIAP
ncbi:MAG: hypothetical protein ACE5GC_06915 [Acidimicrobiia bacterium]